jgi:hypothetical protein
VWSPIRFSSTPPHLPAAAGNLTPQALYHPSHIPFGTEEDGSVIVVDSNDVETLMGEKNRNFGSDQTAGAGH